MVVTDRMVRGRAGGWSSRSLDVILELGHVRGQVGAADPPRPADLDARQGPVLQELEDTASGDPQLGQAAANVWEDHDLVWCQENGRPLDSRADWQEWSDILAEAGIEHAGTHAMRHSAATIAIHEGVALPVVQEMLGHSDIRVTRDYVDVSSPLAQDAAKRVGRVLFGVTVPKIVPKGSPQ